MARPKRELEYSEQIRDLIAQRRSEGKTHQQLARTSGFPGMAQHFSWIQRHPDYARACEEARLNYADTIYDQCCELAEQAKTANEQDLKRIKLQFDILSYSAAKSAPSKYSPQLNQSITNDSQDYKEALREINEKNSRRGSNISHSSTPKPQKVSPDDTKRDRVIPIRADIA